MKVLKTYPTSVDGHVIEIVENEHGTAVRARYQNSGGGYNTASPVVLVADVALIATAAADSDLLSSKEIAGLIGALGSALARRLEKQNPA